MTNLMQQLQAWADRGAFKFPEGDDKGGFTMRKEDSNNPNIGAWELTPEQNFGIKCVLDGTIQVWRPVDKYDPIFDAELYLCLGKDGEQYIGNIYCDVVHHDDFDDHKTYPEITHWQPLPQPPQEVSHAVS